MWTQVDLDAIEAAIQGGKEGGKRRVRLNGREVEYHSIGEMLKARAAISNDVNLAAANAAGVRRPRAYRSRTAKGL